MKGVFTVGLFLPPGFGLPAFAVLNDLFHLLDRERRDAPAISCKTISPDGVTASSSSGRIVKADISIAADATYDLIIVVSAVSNRFDKASVAWLRKQARFGAAFGAVTSGLWLLAHAGVIGNRRCTLHWADLEAFRQHFPEINVTADIYVIEDGLMTCAGLGAVHDMMFAYLSDRFDKRALDAVMDGLIIDRARRPDEVQRLAPAIRFHGAGRLLAAAEQGLGVADADEGGRAAAGLGRAQMFGRQRGFPGIEQQAAEREPLPGRAESGPLQPRGDLWMSFRGRGHDRQRCWSGS